MLEVFTISFFLDWWMLIGIGIFIALFSKIFYKEDSFLKYTLSIVTLVVFYSLSIGLFCELDASNGPLGVATEFFFNMVKDMFPDYYAAGAPGENATSTEFMFSSAELWIKDYTSAQPGLGKLIGSIFKTEVPFNSLSELVSGGHNLYLFFGVAMFCCYPFFLYGGTQIGFLIFGRKPGDKGALGFL